MNPLIIMAAASSDYAEVTLQLFNNRFSLPPGSLFTTNDVGIIFATTFTNSIQYAGQLVQVISDHPETHADVIKISGHSSITGYIYNPPEDGNPWYELEFESNNSPLGEFVSAVFEFRVTVLGRVHSLTIPVYVCRGYPTLPNPSLSGGNNRYFYGIGSTSETVNASFSVTHTTFTQPAGLPSEFIAPPVLSQVGTVTNLSFSNSRVTPTLISSLVTLSNGYINVSRIFQYRLQDPLTGAVSTGPDIRISASRTPTGYSNHGVASFWGFDGNTTGNYLATPQHSISGTNGVQYGYSGGLQGYFLDGGLSTFTGVTFTGRTTPENPVGLVGASGKSIALWVRLNPSSTPSSFTGVYTLARLHVGTGTDSQRWFLEIQLLTFNGSPWTNYRGRLVRESSTGTFLAEVFSQTLPDMNPLSWNFIYVYTNRVAVAIYDREENTSLNLGTAMSVGPSGSDFVTSTDHNWLRYLVLDQTSSSGLRFDYDSIAFFNGTRNVNHPRGLENYPQNLSLPF